jgi:multiple sugar transport system substrate-binding protein
MAVLPLAACLNDDGPDEPYDPAKEEPKADQNYVVEFYGWGDAAEIANYQTIISDFMAENPNILISYSSDNSSTYNQNLRNRADSLPDVFYVPDTEFLMWVSSGKLLDITAGFTDDELNELWPEAVDKYYYSADTATLGKGEGAKLYGLPKDLGPFTMVYNKTLFNSLADQKGLTAEERALVSPTEPMSWTQFRALCKKLDTDPNDAVFGVTHYELEAAAYSNNADFFNEDQSLQKITDANFTQALQFIADLSLVDQVMPNAEQQQATNGYQRFFTGNAVFSFMGPWDCASFWPSAAFEFDVIPVPYGYAAGAQSTAWIGSMSYSISRKSKVQGAALKFAKYLSYNLEAQRKFYKLGQQVPNIVGMAKNEYIGNTQNVLTGREMNPEHRGVFVDVIEGITSPQDKVGGKARARYYTYDSLWYTDLLESLSKVWRGQETAAQWAGGYESTLQYALDEMLTLYRN